MSKNLKVCIYSLLLGVLGYGLFLCIFFYDGTAFSGIIRTIGMAFATVPLIFAGLSFGYIGFVVSIISATLAFCFGDAERFEIFKNFYILGEIVPASIVVISGLPVKGKQLSIGWISTIVCVFVAIFIAVVCYYLGQNMVANTKYDETVKVATFLTGIFENSDIGKNIFALQPMVFKFIKGVIPFIPSLIGMVIVGRILLTAYIGAEISLRINTSLRKKDDYLAISLPKFALIAVLSCIVMAIITNGLEQYLYFNISLILLVPFALMGMAYAHTSLKSKKYGKALLWLFYIIILFTDVWGYLATVLLGAYNYVIKQKEIKKV